MLKYAVKLTKNPSELSLKDIEELRQAGFKDTDILNINLITSYFNLVNRIALGLGVKSSQEEAKGYKY
jgi:alkylhydroperoxidase family enzyme